MKHATNTTAIREHFPQEYEKLLGTSATVVSCSVSCWIVGEHVIFQGGIGAKQSLPLRVYCGVSRRAQPGIHVKKVMPVFIPSAGRFEDHQLQGAVQEFEVALARVVRELYGQDVGLDIQFLSEAPVASGLGASGAMAAACVLAVAVDAGFITAGDVDRLGDNPLATRQLPAPFDDLFRTAWHLDSVVQSRVSSGTACLCGMVGCPVPVVFEIGGPVPTEAEGFRTIAYRAFPVSQLVARERRWPITFGLVFSGMRLPTGQLVGRTKVLREQLKTVADFWHSAPAGPVLPTPGSVLTLEGDRMWHRYTDALSVVSADTVRQLTMLFEHGAPTNEFKQFLDNVELFQHALAYMGLSSRSIDELVATASARRGKNEMLGAKISGGGAGGHAVVFAESNTGSIERLLDDVATRAGGLHLDFCKERDGLDTHGAVVETRARLAVPPPPRRYLVQVWDEKNGLNETTIDEGMLPHYEASTNVVFNKLEKTIHVKGHRLGAREISSATATVKMFTLLLNHVEQRVADKEIVKDLNAQSYQQPKEIRRLVTQLNDALGKRQLTPLTVDVRGEVIGYTARLTAPKIRIAVVIKSV